VCRRQLASSGSGSHSPRRHPYGSADGFAATGGAAG
jgi:hypothetical protein